MAAKQVNQSHTKRTCENKIYCFVIYSISMLVPISITTDKLVRWCAQRNCKKFRSTLEVFLRLKKLVDFSVKCLCTTYSMNSFMVNCVYIISQ